jgi:multidrug efflux pump subunit AcrB
LNKLYSSPFRVYLTLAFFALIGILSSLKLPVSLFPTTSKPTFSVSISYPSSTADEFLNTYGSALEGQLRSISTEDAEIEKITADYRQERVSYDIDFKWGTPRKIAKREVESTVNAYAARFPEEIRNSISTWQNFKNSGFLAVSLFSEKRSLNELYELLEPIFTPLLNKMPDAQTAELYNPSAKEVRLELIPEKMASLQLFPADIERSVKAALSTLGGGSVQVGTKQLNIQMPAQVHTIEELSRVLVTSHAGRTVHLSDVAKIDYAGKSTSFQSFRTNGSPSLILFAVPKAGGNIKKMAEDILEVLMSVMPTLPKDVQYKILVDPSEFIRSAIKNVFHEVAIGALLAVVVLFIFIGSFRNTVTAAIEIPLSMVLAFILMRISGMNINLISLGGLALSAGMNVDASVVVMENIFRHFEEYKGNGPLDYRTKLKIIGEAVKEVRLAVIASTIASVVVFVPLAFTSELSYAVLGDLAKTVVFSHGFSAIVALVLVPTVRLHLMSRGNEQVVHSRFESGIKWLEKSYASLLSKFIEKPVFKWSTYLGLIGSLAILVFFVLPKLPKEIIGKPDTDWMVLSVNTTGNTLLKQIEPELEETEARLLKKLGPDIEYTFVQTWGPNGGSVMARLKDKKKMREVWKQMEAEFTQTPVTFYWVGPWNPAELPIPNPPQMEISIRGGTTQQRATYSYDLQQFLMDKNVYENFWATPSISRAEQISLKPKTEHWPIAKGSIHFLPGDLADLARVMTHGRKLGDLGLEKRLVDIFMRYPENIVTSLEDLAAFPVGVGSKIVPLKSLAQVEIQRSSPSIYREDGKELVKLVGRKKETEEADASKLQKAKELVGQWERENPEVKDAGITLTFEDAEKELNDALKQLATAVGLSILLIFVTMIFQFGSVANALLVLVAVPLGFIGVLVSLLVFKSTLSLNSVLGVILLNGIAVANSIILVDFLKRKVDQGLSPRDAAAEAGKKRLRPILITSCCTILGMLPIALGMGEGGKVLQPLGIAVSGGLWVSMGLTLFIVPALQVSYLEWQQKRAKQKQPFGVPEFGAAARV